MVMGKVHSSEEPLLRSPHSIQFKSYTIHRQTLMARVMGRNNCQAISRPLFEDGGKSGFC